MIESDEDLIDDDITMMIVDDEIDEIEDAEFDIITGGDGDSDAVDIVMDMTDEELEEEEEV